MKSVVIVGHGRSPEGRGWGRHIDRCATVIRMWDWLPWQNARDYGRKYDIGLFEVDPQLMGTFNKYRQADPRRGWIASVLSHPKLCRLPDDTELVDQAPWNAVGRAMGGIGETGRLQFTRGTIAGCWAIEHADPGDRIVLVGFDNVKRGATLPVEEGFSPAYRESPGTFSFRGYRPNETKQGNHDFAIEYPVMQRLAAEHSVRIVFAEDVWN